MRSNNLRWRGYPPKRPDFPRSREATVTWNLTPTWAGWLKKYDSWMFMFLSVCDCLRYCVYLATHPCVRVHTGFFFLLFQWFAAPQRCMPNDEKQACNSFQNYFPGNCAHLLLWKLWHHQYKTQLDVKHQTNIVWVNKVSLSSMANDASPCCISVCHHGLESDFFSFSSFGGELLMAILWNASHFKT